MKAQHIILIGMPASGKSTIGKVLSGLLHMPHMDTDSIFEERMNMKIVDYWKQYGEIEFRIRERNILLEALSNSSSVISTGGGCPSFMDNMFYISSHYSIFLEVEPSILLSRLNTGDRAVFKRFADRNDQQINQLLSERIQYYNRASVIYSNNGDLENTLNNIVSHLFI